VIIEIRRLMVESAETASRGAAGQKGGSSSSSNAQQKQQNGADEKLHRIFWDLGGFPTSYRGSS
jgi:hypothetical protein